MDPGFFKQLFQANQAKFQANPILIFKQLFQATAITFSSKSADLLETALKPPDCLEKARSVHALRLTELQNTTRLK